jgi:HD superfamily phosphodiesterase
MRDHRIGSIEEYVKSIMDEYTVHNFGHVDRVRNWSLFIGRREGYDRLDMCEAAALLHDIGYVLGDGQKHGPAGAEKAGQYLSEKLFFTSDEIEEIVHAIRHHSSNRGGRGKLLDILRDSDMIDGLGAMGILRCFKFRAAKPEFPPEDVRGETWCMGAADFNKRLDSGSGTGRYIIDDLNFQISWYENLATETAREHAEPLIRYMRDYIEELEREVHQCRNLKETAGGG